MDSCIFCRIVAGKIPAEVVFDNERTMAFLDVHPVNLGHLLVVPKAHYGDFISTPVDVLAEMVAVAQRLAKATLAATGASAFNIGINNGSDAGQAVGHMHLHIVPRLKGDGFVHWQGRARSEEEMAGMAKDIRSALVQA